jgi:hypothetical protein
MANAKTNKPNKQTNWKKYILVGVIALIVAAPLLYFGYQKYLDEVDADRFAALRSDFKKLQTEFNKIDPGWEYSEGCTAGGKLDDFKTCSAALVNRRVTNQRALKDDMKIYKEQLVTFAVKTDVYSYVSDTKQPALGIQVKGQDLQDGIICDLDLSGDSKLKNISLYCRDSARKFYFDRTDR